MGTKKRKKIKQQGKKKISPTASSSLNTKPTPTTRLAAAASSTTPNHLRHQHPSALSMNSNQVNQETLFRFLATGGKKCYELFQYLSTSTHWRKHGTLPPLSDEEAALLSHMYQLWLQHHHQDEQQEEDHEFEAGNENSSHDISGDEDDEERGDVDDDESSLDDSQRLSVSVCVSTIKETLLSRTQYSDSFMTLINQLDLLMKSPEPCRTQASDLLEILMLPEFLDRDLNSLEKMFESTETHPGYISACSLALGLVSESEHLLSSSVPSYDAYNAQKRISPNEYFNSLAVGYYLKSDDVFLHLSSLPQSSETVQHNVIACMLLGSLYLRGNVVEIPPNAKTSNTHPIAPNYQAAFDFYKNAALGHNPIAEHKVGYFYDEGLPNGVCNVDIIEAVKWYSLAAELMPDSMHNLAKIYEDGRGGFAPDMTQAVTLYSVAAARGFPLSQVNLGRLFLLGEDGVTRDREAGKRLLTLAAESGDADAQMVVGMIHATPAFGCYDLTLSEHWLRQSLAGGKLDAERLLVRVRQQMGQSDPPLGLNPQCAEVETPKAFTPVPISLNALAAKRRGDDFVYHGLLHAAVLEYSRAFELDRTKLSYFVDRLDALCILGHYEECLTDSSLLLLCVDSDGLEYSPRGSSNSKSQNRVDFVRARFQLPDLAQAAGAEEADSFLGKMRESQEAMNRLYDILVESLGCLFSCTNYPLHEPLSFSRLSNRSTSSSGGGMSSADTGGLLDSYNSLYDQTISSPSSELWPYSFPSSASSASLNGSPDQAAVTGVRSDEHRQQYQQIVEDYMFNLHHSHRDPIICRLLQDCLDWELKSTKSSAVLARLTSYDQYYTSAVIRSGGIPILLSVLSSPSQLQNSQPSLNSVGSETNHNPDSCSDTNTPAADANMKKTILQEQLWLNCASILHNLSFSHMAKKVMHLLSATDGFLIMCNSLRLCRDKILTLSTSPKPSSVSFIFRKIALARTSACIIQILLSSASLGQEEVWDELMKSDLIGGIMATLECAFTASQMESSQDRISFLQHLQHVSFPLPPQNTVLTTKKLQTLLTIRELCLEEGDRILMDTMLTLARLFNIAPSFVLEIASEILITPFERIRTAIISHTNHSDDILESLKSATEFCWDKFHSLKGPKSEQSATDEFHTECPPSGQSSKPESNQLNTKPLQSIPLPPPTPTETCSSSSFQANSSKNH